MSKERIDWHGAFYSAIKLEFRDYRDDLEFKFEQELNTKPLRIDAVIIKKKRDVVIKKDLGAIFRLENILEYKSPDDDFSVVDFNRTMAYCFLYLALNKISPRDLTLTIIGSTYPQAVIKHCAEFYGWNFAEASSGIYRASGAAPKFPLRIQIIDSRKLSAEDDLWLKELRRDLEQPTLEALLEHADRNEEEDTRRYFYALAKANELLFKEKGMDQKLERVFDEWANVIKAKKEIAETEKEISEKKAQYEKHGEEIGRKQGVQAVLELWKQGKSPDEVAQMYGMSI
jgi:hypothetical protein